MTPTPTLWLIYAVAFIFHLPLLSIAFPTELAPRDDSAPSLSEVLERGYPRVSAAPSDEERCFVVPWYSADNLLTFDNRGNKAIILIQASSGGMLCFIEPSDLNRMMPKAIDDDVYKELYTDAYLGPDGYLMRAMRQLLGWHLKAMEESCQASFTVLDIQMGAPGVQNDLQHYELIRRIAIDLKFNLKVNLGSWAPQPDWSIPVFVTGSRSVGLVGIWKTYEPSHVAKVWITGAYGSTGGNIGRKQLAEVALLEPTAYPNQDNHRGEGWLTFDGRTVKYLERGQFPTKQAPQTILDLYAATRATKTAHIKWMPYKKEGTYEEKDGGAVCEQVSWSKDGSLLGFINTGNCPLYMIQTTRGSVICQISNKKWWKLYDDWKAYKMKPNESLLMKYQQALDELFQQLKPMISGADRGWGGQLWVPSTGRRADGPFADMMKDIVAEMRWVIHHSTFDSTQSDVRVEYFFIYEAELPKARDGNDYQFNAVWQPPYTEDAPTRDVWIWKMGKIPPQIQEIATEKKAGGGAVKNKFPAAKLDLLNKEKPYEYIISPVKLE